MTGFSMKRQRLVPLAFSLLFDRVTHRQLHDQPARTQVAPVPLDW